MELSWVREDPPVWDADKERVIGGAPAGAFVIPFTEGQVLPGEWWSVRDAGEVVGYGRLDVTWGGDAEILLAVHPGRQGEGIGSFLLGRLEREAATRGLNYVHNRIREHPERDLVHDWLVVRGFRGPPDGDLRKRVGRPGDRQLVGAPPSEPSAAPSREPVERTPPGSPPVFDADADRGPGEEEQGGYVDVDEHRY